MAKTTTTAQPSAMIWRANLWTDHFRFEAYGATEKTARAALLAGFKTHAKQYGLARDWWRSYEPDCEAFTIGQPYRDGAALPVD